MRYLSDLPMFASTSRRLQHPASAVTCPREHLDHWRRQLRQTAETLECGLPLNSIALPVLEADHGAAAAMVAHYEALVAREEIVPN